MKNNSLLRRKNIEKVVKETIAELIGSSSDAPHPPLDLGASFLELGINSVQAVELVEALNQKLGIELGVEVMFDYRDAKELSAFIFQQYGKAACSKEVPPRGFDVRSSEEGNSSPDRKTPVSATPIGRDEKQRDLGERRSSDIAIIGMSGRFAGSPNLETFWSHLQAGESCIEPIRRQGWEPDTNTADPTHANPSPSKWGGMLEHIDRFDPLFFNISPLEATRMDPQQRLFLEETYKAFEDAGYSAEQLSDKSVGVFVGARASDYHAQALLHRDNARRMSEIDSHLFLGNDMAILAARISYFLNCKGPSLTIDTACSSSLVAVHLACESLRTGESEMALAGAVFVLSSPEFYVMTSKINVLSPDGICRAFDNAANGMVIGEGVGAIVLKPLETALSDGDHIYGLIKGSAMNQDGKTSGITAPSQLAQKALLVSLYKKAGIHPETISYIEAHGTGTRLGDPIEMKALTEAFYTFTDRTQFCAVGSLKPNIGHTIMSAGIAGVLKILMAMKYQQIPPSINVEEVNRQIDVQDSPFFINTELREWPSPDAHPRRAGISSFGFSGTNCHVILEEPPPRRDRACPCPQKPARPYAFFPFSAKTKAALRHKIEAMINWLEKEGEHYASEDISYTLVQGRSHFAVRSAVVARDTNDLLHTLSAMVSKGELECDGINEKGKSKHSEPKLHEYGHELLQALRDNVSLAPEEYQEKLLLLADLYMQGERLDWGQLFAEGHYSRVPLPTYPFLGESYWIPMPISPNPHVGVGGLVPTQIPASRQEMQEMEELLCKLLWSHLQSLGLFREKHAALTHLREQAGISANYDRWLQASATFLAHQQYLHGHDAEHITYTVVDPTLVEPATVWQLWDPHKERWMQDADLKARVALAETMLRALPDILTGKRLPTEVMFPDASMELVEGIYQYNRLADPSNEVLAQQLVTYLQERLTHDRDTRFRILELGAGTGGTTNRVLQMLQPYQASIAEYCYSDISKVFLRYGQRKYAAECPYLTYQIFNVEKPPAEQGIGLGSYDVMIATNVLHATSNIRHTVRNVKAVLKKHGLLLLNEITGTNLFTHLTFGLLKGWWAYADPELRVPGGPALSAESWLEVLSSEGFGAISIPIQETQEFGQQVIVGLAGEVFSVEKTSPTLPTLPTDKLHESLAHIVSDLLKVRLEDIDPETALSAYGFDSITFMEFANRLNQSYQLDLTAPLFYEHSTIGHLAQYLQTNYATILAPYLGSNNHIAPDPHVGVGGRDNAGWGPCADPVPTQSTPFPNQHTPTPIAIIGMSGTFPQSPDVLSLWNNLLTGKDCISEIPPSRWDWQTYFGNPATEVNKTNIKWAGIVEDVELFDPLFFGISPREAEQMDPQQRLLMMYVWKAIEDAGYSAKSLSGTNTALFVGTMNSGYNERLSRTNGVIEGYSSTGQVLAVGPNRMSYFLNLHGPSEPIETACSSSLIAIHRGVNAIESGACDMAIVGGVNTLISPELHISFSKAGMLSSDGHCKTFSADANGYVRSEGVGMLMLKRLDLAEQDGDHIYGVIVGSAENHGGRASSLTAPNPRAQADVLIAAYRKAGIDPRTVGYIEAHGTGTPLGDPIEINGLKTAFNELVGDLGRPHPWCGIGSLKSNIGHLEWAAGVVGVIKVLLQLQHKKLVKSLHCEQINPYIQLEGSPFYIVQENLEWETLRDRDGNPLPRRAGISSFGFGGVNAHVVLEEYMPKPSPTFPTSPTSLPALIVLSAKDEERLHAQVRQLLTWMQALSIVDASTGDHKGAPLLDLAYTLQVGREAMEERLALQVSSFTDLMEKLGRYVQDPQEAGDWYRGQERQYKDMIALWGSDEELQETIDKWLQRGKYEKLLQGWVKGLTIDWKLLSRSEPRTHSTAPALPHRISLPTYPFALERYWLPAPPIGDRSTAQSTVSTAPAITTHSRWDGSLGHTVLHPLVQHNNSTLREQRFFSTFYGDEFFLADHVVKGQRVLPAVAYLEMARAAVALAAEVDAQTSISLHNIVWIQPLIVEEQPLRVSIKLSRNDDSTISYAISSTPEAGDTKAVVHCQGMAMLDRDARQPQVDLTALQAKSHQQINACDCYATYQAMGIEYGSTFQTLEYLLQYAPTDRKNAGSGLLGQAQELQGLPQELLARISLPSARIETLNMQSKPTGYVLHPSMMDGALQASVGFLMGIDTTGRHRATQKPMLPFALDTMDTLAPCESNMWALLRLRDSESRDGKSQKIDIDVYDEHGQLCVRLIGFSTRALENTLSTQPTPSPPAGSNHSQQTHMLMPAWETIPTPPVQSPSMPITPLTIIGGTAEEQEALLFHAPNSQIINIHPTDTIATIVDTLAGYEPLEHLVWIAPPPPIASHSDEAMIGAQDQGVLFCFRTIKALLQLDYGHRELSWSVITHQAQPIHARDTVNPTHASIHGLIGSLAKEYPNWSIRLIDLEAHGAWPLLELFSLPPDPQGNARVYRAREWYQQQLRPVGTGLAPVRGTFAPSPWASPSLEPSGYRSGGIYVVIGGAGGVGEVFSEYVIRKYQAQVIWIGRRKIDASILAKQARLATLGPKPHYIMADASNRSALQQAYEGIKRHFGQINGIIHSAIVLLDQSLANMTEERFQTALAAKIDISVHLAHVFSQEPLDFVLFFSSLNTFTKMPGQSNYAAGCTFADAFAQSWNLTQKQQEQPYAVKIINWGYWGSVGVATSPEHQEWMAKAGLGSLEPAEAMEALEILLTHPIDQCALVKTTYVGVGGGVEQGGGLGRPHSPIKRPPYLNNITLTDQMLKDHIQSILIESVAEVSDVQERFIQEERNFSEYGVDSIIAVKLINVINKKCQLTLRTTALFDNNNIKQLLHYILRKHMTTLRATLQERELEDRTADISEGRGRGRGVVEWGVSETDPVNPSTPPSSSHQHVILERPGEINDLTIGEAEIRELQDHEVRITVYAFSLNFGDLLCIKGLYPTMPPYPFTPGLEASGVVLDIGRAVTAFRPGDAVMAIAGSTLGAHATVMTCPEEHVFHKPATLSFEEACALPVVAITMIAAFEKARLKQGEKILIQTATGGTGLIAIQLAQYYKAEIYATAGSQFKLDYLKQLGVPYRINYQEMDFEQEIKRLTEGQGVDVVINTLSGQAMQKGMNCLSPGGRYIEVAMTALKSARGIDLSVFSQNQTFYSVDLRKLAQTDPATFKHYCHEMLQFVDQGIITPTIGRIFAWQRLKDAYRSMENRQNIGKIVVRTPQVHQGSHTVDRQLTGTGPDPYVEQVSPAWLPMPRHEPIAIIGMSGRFAHSKNVSELWEHLANGTDLIEEVSRWNLAELSPESFEKKEPYCKHGSFLEGIDLFDPLFFNISGLEATYMDPQQRLVLEEAWKALEDAGYAGSSIEGRQCGVYMGCATGDYQQLFKDVPPAQAFWGNAGSVIPARIAYYLNLQGPAIAIDTACSSSLVAIHLACQGLCTGEIDMALAGGIFLQCTPQFYQSANHAGMLSSTGCCSTFDDRADGFVPGEGVGMVVIKRLKDALASGDHIYAVIRGSGINQDGATRGITAPSANSQERLMRSIYETFQIEPSHIQMVEAHGTGTKLGDPIEYEALTRTFRSYTDRQEYCALGSIKTNLGHTVAAAGIASVIKILLSLQHKQIPPSLHFQTGNAHIQFTGSPFYVNTRLQNWEVEAGGMHRCAAISSFGFSGTNAHLVIEEAPERPRRHTEKPGYLIVLSARTAEQLRQQVEQLVAFCQSREQLDCGNISYTLLLGRKHLKHRLTCIVHSHKELGTLLRKWLEKGRVPQVFVSNLENQELRENPSLRRYGNQCIEDCQRWAGAVGVGLAPTQAPKPEMYLEQLSTVADLYLQGYTLAFEQLFAGEEYSRIPLPTYPFASERYWIPTATVGTYPPVPTVMEAVPIKSATQEEQQAILSTEHETLRERASTYFKKQLAALIKLPTQQIEASAPLEAYGFDSIMAVNFTNILENSFGPLSKTLLFEYPTLHSITEYFLHHYPEQLRSLVGNFKDGIEEQITNSADANLGSDTSVVLGTSASNPHMHRSPKFGPIGKNSFPTKTRQDKETMTNDIAIIGLAGRYPGARDLRAFWENLRQGRDCITEIPPERWDHRLYFDADKNKPGTTYSKWGGFLEGVDEFDPLFFNISPHEAELMDPQERLFLECVAATLEDAGYTREGLSIYQGNGLPGNVGVFVGVMYEEYQLFGAEAQIQGQPIALAGNPSSIANRVSYFYNLHGPSIAVDTMCSSSLTAIHLACQNIQHGGCELAIAGGVNVSIHPNKYLFLGQGKFISSSGHCQSFGVGADGYVPGEGVGVVLLKPLVQAEEDGDHIYGVIKATTINHGGKTNGYTVPNPQAQAAVIRQALREAKIDPRTISYIEAHGTGTVLGDPIEIAALTHAFQNVGGRDLGRPPSSPASPLQWCAIGSVKSNIGHAESAAGIAGLTKVLLQMRYRQLVPSLHSRSCNPHIDFSATPFVVQQELSEWKRPQVPERGTGTSREVPRRAGISSFGAGGSNAHVILEEYVAMHQENEEVKALPSSPVLIVLSARTQEKLQEQVHQLLDWMHEWNYGEDVQGLYNLAYTLQVGREPMEERLALQVSSLTELLEKLQRYIEGGSKGRDWYRGQVKRNDPIGAFAVDEDGQKTISAWISKGKYEKLLEWWVRGLTIDWKLLYTVGAGFAPTPTQPRRVSLPTYPFAREHYWISTSAGTGSTQGLQPSTPTGAYALHPLVQRNTSTLWEQRFSSTFHGDEFFLADHVVKGQSVMPGVAYLEMVHVALAQANSVDALHEPIQLHLNNVVWVRPLICDRAHPVTVHIVLEVQENGTIAFVVSRETQEEETTERVYCQGIAELHAPSVSISHVDLPAVQARCPHQIEATECYQHYRELGISYGPAHQGIEQLSVGEDEVLARLRLPSVVAQTRSNFVLHPSVLDSALQACIGLLVESVSQVQVPFALDELETVSEVPTQGWAWVRRRSQSVDESVFDIEVYDDEGYLTVRLHGLRTRPLPRSFELLRTALLTPNWKEEACPSFLPSQDPPVPALQVVLLCELPNIEAARIQFRLIESDPSHTLKVENWQSQQPRRELRFQDTVIQLIQELQHLLQSRSAGAVLVQVVVAHREEPSLLVALASVLKTAQQEYPKLQGQVIEVAEEPEEEELLVLLRENQYRPQESHIRYQDGKRWVKQWRELDQNLVGVGDLVSPLAQREYIPWKEGGCYLITGGAGGLAQLFVQEIARQVQQATIILCGRSALPRGQWAQLEPAENGSIYIDYQQVDVSDGPAVHALIQRVLQKYGHLDGIIHAAGILHDSLLLHKTEEEVRAVLTPKVIGVEHLDKASSELPLDFFILCSSLAAVVGNVGQADYAAANAYLDAFAHVRAAKVATGERQGATLSINWPYWKAGGMQVDASTLQMMRERLGLEEMGTETGMIAFYQALTRQQAQVIVLHGQVERIQQRLLQGPNPSLEAASVIEKTAKGISEEAQLAVNALGEQELQERATNYFKKQLATAIKLSVQQIDEEAPLIDYGFDSIMAIRFTNILEDTFGSLSKTFLFEHATLDSVTTYFLHNYPKQLRSLLGNIKDGIEEVSIIAKPRTTQEHSWGRRGEYPLSPTSHKQTVARRRPRHRLARWRPDQETRVSDIAIIGLAGRYPGARDLQTFWENLRQGRDCITEIPASRWYHQLYSETAKTDFSTIYSKWGGFLEGVDEFDPLFFGISPREAERIDPQERLFLECAYATLEDAGYAPRSKSGRDERATESDSVSQSSELSCNVGVFVGVMYEEYQLFGAEAQIQGQPVALTGSPSSIANRVSHFCNLHGPSIAVDTMCSSSLTAIHLACQSIHNGDCELAIAGGVNVSIHPNKYLLLGQDKFISSSGHCQSFGMGADGYVPSEGVGAVLLKPLVQAEEDGDHIYGVIKATAINHGGKTNGYTVPNPHAQTEVIRQALRKAEMDPRTISYIEAHGTGTVLGDPIEIAGLTRAFQRAGGYTGGYGSSVGVGGGVERGGGLVSTLSSPASPPQWCAIGSVKSNIGHTESAAGIAGVTKVLLQMRHGQLVPSLHSKSCNPHIDFSATPFVVQQELSVWKRPQVPERGTGTSREVPRRAGISSFGAGGSNAHMILEEYVDNAPCRGRGGGEDGWGSLTDPVYPALLVLSARTEAQLHERVRQLLAWIEERERTDEILQDLAYTLQVGREPMEERLALQVSSLTELEEKLQRYIEGGLQGGDWYQGQVKRNDPIGAFAADEDGQKTISAWISKGKYEKLLEWWVRGLTIDWKLLYTVGSGSAQGTIPTAPTRPRRVSLPTYPFARKRYWLPTPTVETRMDSGRIGLAPVRPLPEDSCPTPTSRVALRSLADNPVFSRAGCGNHNDVVGIVPNTNGASHKVDASHRTGLVPGRPYNITNPGLTPGLEEELVKSLAKVLYIEQGDIDVEKPFVEMGLDSVLGVEWIQSLNKQYTSNLTATTAYDYPTIRQLAGFLEKEVLKQRGGIQQTPAQSMSTDMPQQACKIEETEQPLQPFSPQNAPLFPHQPEEIEGQAIGRKDAIAIIGMSGKYPDAKNLSKYWDNLVQGKNAIREIPHSRFNVSDYYDPNPEASGKIYCKWLGALDDIECFDPLFFHLSPAEAELMDPQQRLFLEEGYKAFEDAGYSPELLSNRKCGVYLGIMSNEYSLLLSEKKASGARFLGTSFAIAAARLAYLLNLKGPALAIDTACSSSLAAMHVACQALRNQEIDMALVGGVSLYLTPESYLGMCSAGMLSPDGQCKTFDASANGFVPGEGIGACVLKRLADAEADHDQIYGVIIGSGMNQDGATNGITAPSVKSQIDLVREIYGNSQIDPASISYVEMHGTGTKLGDPIELQALATVFGEKTQRKRYCTIGSVKSNIGHTSAAAGMASLQKVLLAMKQKKLVPSLHFKQPNEHFDFEASPFYVNTEVQDWNRAAEGTPLRAAVSSFGFSGTNTHLVVEEYIPVRVSLRDVETPCLLVLSANSEQQLKSYAQELKEWIQAHSELTLEDIAFTLQMGRSAMDHRLAIEASSREILLQRLEGFVENRTTQGVHTAQVKKHTQDATIFEADEDGQSLLHIWCQKKKFAKIAQVWVRGVHVDWMLLYTVGAESEPRTGQGSAIGLVPMATAASTLPHRVSLPTYPFARERYWIPTVGARSAPALTSSSTTTVMPSSPVDIPQREPTLSAPTVPDHRPRIALRLLTDSPVLSESRRDQPKNADQPQSSISASLSRQSFPQSIRNDEVKAGESPALPLNMPTTLSVDGETNPQLEQELAMSLAQSLYMELHNVDVEKSFGEMGLDSVIGAEWIQSLNKQYGSKLSPSNLYDYPTIRQLADFLQKNLSKPTLHRTEPYSVILAPNPSLLTSTGTKTIVLGDQSTGAVVIDPATNDPAYLSAIIQEGQKYGGVRRILITHGHPDHIGGAEALRAQLGVPLLAFSKQRVPWADEEIADNTHFPIGDDTLRALHTPGHAPDHLCFWLERQRILFAGDLVTSNGPALILGPPEGDLQDYIHSLKRVQNLESVVIVPAHGKPILRPQEMLAECLTRCQKRKQQILEAVQNVPQGIDIKSIIHAVYKNVDASMYDLLTNSVLSNLSLLEREDLVKHIENQHAEQNDHWIGT